MQTANAFSQVEASLAFLVLRYYSNTEASIAQLQTVVARLMDFTSQMEETKNVTASAEIQRVSGVGNAIQLRELPYEGLEKEGMEPWIEEVLRLVGLDHLCEKLNVDATWSQILSLGEQQRLSIAKVLLNPPQWLFLDEATSALDGDNEDLMYGLLQSKCPHMTIVSVAHRPRLRQYHRKELRLQGEGTYTLCSC